MVLQPSTKNQALRTRTSRIIARKPGLAPKPGALMPEGCLLCCLVTFRGRRLFFESGLETRSTVKARHFPERRGESNLLVRWAMN
jgi:hypothetical protein